MPNSSSKQPFNWDDYEYGRSPRQGSEASLGSHVYVLMQPYFHNIFHVQDFQACLESFRFGDYLDIAFLSSSLALRK